MVSEGNTVSLLESGPQVTSIGGGWAWGAASPAALARAGHAPRLGGLLETSQPRTEQRAH